MNASVILEHISETALIVIYDGKQTGEEMFRGEVGKAPFYAFSNELVTLQKIHDNEPYTQGVAQYVIGVAPSERHFKEHRRHIENA